MTDTLCVAACVLDITSDRCHWSRGAPPLSQERFEVAGREEGHLKSLSAFACVVRLHASRQVHALVALFSAEHPLEFWHMWVNRSASLRFVAPSSFQRSMEKLMTDIDISSGENDS
ncbi:unnamed protein product, partial [Ectocarpus sp. 4 AP-2014]